MRTWWIWLVANADYYFCGTGKLALLEGWWLREPANPIFSWTEARAQRQSSHRCIALPGRCNAAVLVLPPVTGGCAVRWSLVERNRANPPEDHVMAEMSADIWNDTGTWKEVGSGNARFFPNQVNCQGLSWNMSPGCATGMAPSGAYGPRRGFVAVNVTSPLSVAVGANGIPVISQSTKEIHTVQPFSTIASGTSVTADGVPAGMSIDSGDNLYVALSDLHVVTKRAPGGTSTIVAGSRGTSGAGLNQLNAPTYVFAAQSGLVIADTGNHRVVFWKEGASQGVVVAGNGTRGTTLQQLDSPAGVAMDNNGHIYVCDEKNNRVMRWEKNATEGSVILGNEDGSTGAAINMLNAPSGLAVSEDIYAVDPARANPDVFVADSANDRIVVVSAPYTQPVLVSGEVHQDNRSLSTLLRPRDLAIDAANSLLFVVDEHNRVVQYGVKRIPHAVDSNCANDLCCHAQCASRFTLSSDARFVCNSRGQWVEETAITCTPYACSEFPEIATFTEWQNGTISLLVANSTLSSGATMAPACGTGTGIDTYRCDRGEIIQPYPWCVAESVDVVRLAAVVVSVQATTEEEAFANLGRPEGELRYLARHRGEYYVAVTAQRPRTNALHPVYALEHELKVRINVTMTRIDWNFSFPYPKERNKALDPTPPTIVATPDPFDIPGSVHFAWFVCLVGALIVVGFLFQPVGPGRIRNWRKSSHLVWRLWILTVAHVALVGASAYMCASLREERITCAIHFNETRHNFTECQHARITGFTAACNGTWSVAPEAKAACFQEWPDPCTTGEVCGNFADPCGWVTPVMCIIALTLGYFVPTIAYAKKPSMKIAPEVPVVTLGGFSVARAGGNSRLLQYTIQLPVGITGGQAVRFPLDVECGTAVQDDKLKGKFAQIEAPTGLGEGESFSIVYDRENGQTEILAKSPKRQSAQR